MDQYDLHDKPCQLFNVDKTGMPLNPKPLKMVCSTGSKNPVSTCSENKSQITIVGCVMQQATVSLLWSFVVVKL